MSDSAPNRGPGMPLNACLPLVPAQLRGSARCRSCETIQRISLGIWRPDYALQDTVHCLSLPNSANTLHPGMPIDNLTPADIDMHILNVTGSG